VPLPRSAARLVVACLLAVTAACANLQPQSLGGRAGERSLTGRLSVHYQHPNSGRDETVFAGFEWTETAGLVRIELLDPLGQGLAVIETSRGAASLTLRDGRHFSGATPEELTQNALGWSLPVSGLSAWLDGRSAHAGVVLADASGDRHLDEDGWHITFSGADDAGVLPRRIDLGYSGPGPAVEMRIAIAGRGRP
jgi:outer membrane lipoprotein LolB